MRHASLPGRVRSAAALVLGFLAVSAGAQAAPHPSPAKGASKAYVWGRLDGALGPALTAVLAPSPWTGQADGMVLMAGNAVSGLGEPQKQVLSALHRKGKVIVLTHATQGDIDALNQLLGLPRTTDVPASLGAFDFYASTLSPAGFRAFAMAPAVGGAETGGAPAEEPRERLRERARALRTWMAGFGPGAKSATAAPPPPSAPLQIYNEITSWQVSYQYPVVYSWATCGTSTQTCTNNYQLFLNAWPVYSQTNAQSSSSLPTDFFIMQLSGNFNPSGCFGFYGNRNHPNRISAYWARQYNLGAAVAGNPQFSDLNIYPVYNPQAANPSVTVNTGTTWSLSGTGTVGAKGASAGFTAGVSFNNSTSATYQALQVQPNIGANPAAPNVASWTYDSWEYVHSSIQPSNHACGGSGLAQLPASISKGTFSPAATWVWQASPNLRKEYNGTTLPVQMSASVLLGWTFYQGGQNTSCKPTNTSDGTYPLEYSFSSWKVGTSPLEGLTYDVGCNTGTEYGTIPLGPTSNQNWGIGNPGTPYALPLATAYVPFAPTAAPVGTN